MKKKKKKAFCDLCNTEAENETEIGAPPPFPPAVRACMFQLFISNYKFRIYYQSSISKQQNNNLLLYTRVYYNVSVYEHTCSLFHG